MIRKTIQTLDEMQDSKFFAPGVELRDLQKDLRGSDEQKSRRARLFLELASITKRFVNEGVAFEALLSEAALENVSKAIYAIQWSNLYYEAETERRARAARGYWKCLWDALRGR